LNPAWQDWVNAHMGGLVEINDRIYRVDGRLNPKDFHSVDAVQLYDVTTGQTVYWQPDEGAAHGNTRLLPTGYNE